MKLLIIASMYPPYIKGGGEISTKLLAEELVNQGIDVTILTIDYEPKNEIINGVKIKRVTPPNVYWSYNSPSTSKPKKILWHINEAFNPFQSQSLKSWINEADFDLVHSSVVEDFSTNIWRYFKAANIPVLHTLRSYYLMCYKASLFKNGSKCIGRCHFCKFVTQLKKVNSQYVDYVIGISNDILDRHLNAGFFSDSNYSIIPNSYESPTTFEHPKQNDHDRHINFGFIGKLDYHKGIDYLLEKSIEINKHIHANIIIAGFGPLESIVRKYDEKFPFIKFLGKVKPKEFYSKIDVLIVPSMWNEPFGRIVIEAYSFGKPVIATNNGGLPELIDKNKTGYIFNPNKPEQLINYCKILSSDRKKLFAMSEVAYKESLKYSNENVAKKYVDIYNSLVT